MQIGLIGALTILFVALKLLGAIAWSWLWVLSPLWIGIPIVLLFVFAVLLLAAVANSR
jgi:hypothetical protein